MSVLAIYGAGGLGREVLELARLINDRKKEWDDIIFVVDGESHEAVNGCTVLSYELAKEKYENRIVFALGIGEPIVRERIIKKLNNDNFYMPNLIHPDVYIPDSTEIGNGVIVQADCFISVNATIQDYVFLQPKCAIGHDCLIGEGTIISSFDSIAGSVQIGRYSYLGMGVLVKEHVSIGNYSIVGMGSAVFKDVPDEMIAMGNPARPMKNNEERKVFGHR